MPRPAALSSVLIVLALAGTHGPARAQTLQGEVVDATNGSPVALAGIYLVDEGRRPVATAMADSAGRYVLSAPEGGEYVLLVQRLGYYDVESPMVAIGESGTYGLDFELTPEPLGLSPITVTVRNEALVDWLTLELGGNPAASFGFRVLQGQRLEEAKVKARHRTTETLRWLYIPVSHAGPCVRVNQVPRPTGRPRDPQWGTHAREAEARTEELSCGSLYLNDRRVPNEHLEEVDMSQVAVVVTLPGTVRMYTYAFDWSFRHR